MSSVEPTSDVWEHGLLPLPGAKLSEASLLALLELQHRLPADLSVGLEQWAALASELSVRFVCYKLMQLPTVRFFTFFRSVDLVTVLIDLVLMTLLTDARDLPSLLYYRFKVRLELEQRHVRALRAYARVVRSEPHRREQVGLALGRPREERRGQLPRPARVVAAVAAVVDVRAPSIIVRQRRGPALGLEAALRE